MSSDRTITTTVNKALRRPIKNGYEFNDLIPKLQIVVHHFDNNNSDTYDTLKFMKEWTIKYYKQLERVAPLLRGQNIQETVLNIYEWLYDHFQYNIDTDVQKLFAPSSAWHYRYTGIDCKSYSLLASCLLINLNIPHSFRKVKLRGKSNWGHVYVVVHDNNNDYVIDATTHDNREVHYNQKYDLNMSGLSHIGLASSYNNNENQMYNNAFVDSYPALNCSCNNNYLAAGEDGEPNVDWVKKLFKDLNLSGLFNSIKCWGGTAFDAAKLKILIPTITNYFISIIGKYNQAIQEKRFNDVHQIFVEFWLKRNALLLVYSKKHQEGWNPCSDASFEFVLDFLDNKIWKVLGLSFEKHIITYFQIGEDRVPLNYIHPANSQDYFDSIYMWGTHLGSATSAAQHGYSANVQPATDSIPAFIMTPEIEAALNSDISTSTINLNSVLHSIQAAAPIIFSIIGSGDTNNDGTGTGSGGNITPKPKVIEAGFGTVAGIVIALGAGAYYFKNKDKKTEANV